MKKYLLMMSIAFIATIIFFAEPVFAGSGQISTSGGNRSTTWVEISLDNTYMVLGLSARDVLGKPTGTLSEFATAMEHVSGTDTIIFPANYFYAYGGPNANQIIGSIISNRQIVNQTYFDQAVGFRGNNNMFFFDFYRADGALVGHNAPYYPYRRQYTPLGFSPATSFLAFPRLIQHGVRLPIQDMPGATIEWQNRRVQRAFMGQRWDGTFVVGNISGANMREVQDVATYFNLATAVNIDGGASAGIWRNGTYLTRPGRQLASVVFITNNRYNITLNGAPLAIDAYVQNVNGVYMLPLGAALEAFGFEPRFNPQYNTITFTRGGSEISYFVGTFFKQVDGEPHALAVASLPGGTGPSGGAHTLAPLHLVADLAGINVSVFSEGRTVEFVGMILNQPIEEEDDNASQTDVPATDNINQATAPATPASNHPVSPPASSSSRCESCYRIFGYCPCPACPC